MDWAIILTDIKFIGGIVYVWSLEISPIRFFVKLVNFEFVRKITVVMYLYMYERDRNYHIKKCLTTDYSTVQPGFDYHYCFYIAI